MTVSKREFREAKERELDLLRMPHRNGVLSYPLTLQDGSKVWMTCRDTTEGRTFVDWVHEHDSYNWQGRWRWLRKILAFHRTWMRSHGREAV